MTTPRSNQIDLNSTSFYHCIARCVRRSYLCGVDDTTQKDFSHRKQWILDRIMLLTRSFYIDIGAYAIMSNHYHLILHVNIEGAEQASLEELLQRWKGVFPLDANKLSKKMENGDKNIQKEITSMLRKRLSDISWFMRCLNETIAKMANVEDNCTGRFWEGRFKSQALLDEAALLSAMVYVDLNPIRAGMAQTPEQSDFTSIQQRIRSFASNIKAHTRHILNKQPSDLMPFIHQEYLKDPDEKCIDFTLEDYLNLVDTTGRIVLDNKRSAIPEHLAPLLERLNLTATGWVNMVSGIENNFCYAVGSAYLLHEFMPGIQKRTAKTLQFAKQCYLNLVA